MKKNTSALATISLNVNFSLRSGQANGVPLNVSTEQPLRIFGQRTPWESKIMYLIILILKSVYYAADIDVKLRCKKLYKNCLLTYFNGCNVYKAAMERETNIERWKFVIYRTWVLYLCLHEKWTRILKIKISLKNPSYVEWPITGF